MTREGDAAFAAQFRATIERFSRAVTELALGGGDLRARLSDAWAHVIAVQALDVPDEVRGRFEDMEAVWFSREPSQLSDEEVEQAARSVLVMEAELLTLLGAHARDAAPATSSNAPAETHAPPGSLLQSWRWDRRVIPHVALCAEHAETERVIRAERMRGDPNAVTLEEAGLPTLLSSLDDVTAMFGRPAEVGCGHRLCTRRLAEVGVQWPDLTGA